MTGSDHQPVVLIVEDDGDIRRYLRATIQAHDMTAIEAATAREAMQAIVLHRPDVILLDLGLPDRDGGEVISELRGFSTTPVIVLSARGQEADKIAALEAGADDYLTKPFAPGELVARLRVALRHAARQAAISTQHGTPDYDVGGLVVDLASRRVRLDGEDVRLTPIEYRLLAVLARYAGKVVTHAQLLKEVWDKHSLDQSHLLRIHTQHLREKLKDDALAPRFILTEPGIGYRLKD